MSRDKHTLEGDGGVAVATPSETRQANRSKGRAENKQHPPEEGNEDRRASRRREMDKAILAKVEGLEQKLKDLTGDVENFRFGRDRRGDEALLRGLARRFGLNVFPVPSLIEDGEVVSSSLIRDLIRDGEVARALMVIHRSSVG